MAIQKNRKRIFVKGLGTMEVREVLPSPASSFSNVGYIENTNLNDVSETDEIIDETGNVINILEKSRKTSIESNLLQTGIDEINVLKNADSKYYAIHYRGLTQSDTYQYYCIEQAKINAGAKLSFISGKRVLPLTATSINLTDENGFTVPLYYINETASEMYLDDLQLWIEVPQGLNNDTTKVLDISGFARHGTLNSDFATIWNTGTPAYYLEFDGVNDKLDLGDIFDINATDDFMIEAWVKILGADGNALRIIIKTPSGSIGWRFNRANNNKLQFILHDGTNLADLQSSSNFVSSSGWKHIAVAGDRNGTAQLYINGVADGNAVDISGVLTTANAGSLFVAHSQSAGDYSNIDFGMLRCHNYGAGNLPSNISAQILSHYNAEKTKYGL